MRLWLPPGRLVGLGRVLPGTSGVLLARRPVKTEASIFVKPEDENSIAVHWEWNATQKLMAVVRAHRACWATRARHALGSDARVPRASTW